MIAYANQVEHLLKKFPKYEVIQIPRERNAEADKLARIASAVEGNWAGDIVLLNADTKSYFLDVNVVEKALDWRVLIVQALRSGQIPEGPGAPRKSMLARFFLIGNFLY